MNSAWRVWGNCSTPATRTASALLKGFGAKTQRSVIEGIEFLQSQSGLRHYAAVEPAAEALLATVRETGARAEATGGWRRRAIVLDQIELVASGEGETLSQLLQDPTVAPDRITGRSPEGIPAVLHRAADSDFDRVWFETTATEAHRAQLPDKLDPNAGDETAIYASAGLATIPPELREGRDEIDRARDGTLPELIQASDIRGVVHNHTTWSDGGSSVEIMARACIERGYEYLVVSDHSKSAVYAGGLTVEEVAAQHAEIDALNEKLAPFRIFKSIESDILTDGSLDYEEDVLATFDLVIASIHSAFKMDEAQATARLIQAASNPFTTVLGHPTGRMLLAREGYPVNFPELIAACAEHEVVLELNANPFRLDIDWQWIPQAVAAGVPISIDPDAHSIHGIDDIRYGVLAARKGGLTASACWNAFAAHRIRSGIGPAEDRPILMA